MIYRPKLYKSSPNGKTNILLGLISRNKLTLLLNVTIIIKTEKMQRNKLPFALQRRIIQSLILLIILTPLYIYIDYPLRTLTKKFFSSLFLHKAKITLDGNQDQALRVFGQIFLFFWEYQKKRVFAQKVLLTI